MHANEEKKMAATIIRPARTSESERAVSALVIAFASDPVMRWLWPEADSFLRNFPRMMRAFGGFSYEHQSAHVDDDFRGAALWLPMGVESDGPALAALFQETLSSALLAEAGQLLEEMGSHHTQQPHWYLAMIGVDAAKQGSGLGSLLIRKQLDVCDSEGLHAYLESSNSANVPFYERHGFEVTAEIQVGSSPTVRTMLRPPR
jgi:ribosomal protein S18 acetylase RimI-like enzyme